MDLGENWGDLSVDSFREFKEFRNKRFYVFRINYFILYSFYLNGKIS